MARVRSSRPNWMKTCRTRCKRRRPMDNCTRVHSRVLRRVQVKVPLSPSSVSPLALPLFSLLLLFLLAFALTLLLLRTATATAMLRIQRLHPLVLTRLLLLLLFALLARTLSHQLLRRTRSSWRHHVVLCFPTRLSPLRLHLPPRIPARLLT